MQIKTDMKCSIKWDDRAVSRCYFPKWFADKHKISVGSSCVLMSICAKGRPDTRSQSVVARISGLCSLLEGSKVVIFNPESDDSLESGIEYVCSAVELLTKCVSIASLVLSCDHLSLSSDFVISSELLKERLFNTPICSGFVVSIHEKDGICNYPVERTTPGIQSGRIPKNIGMVCRGTKVFLSRKDHPVDEFPEQSMVETSPEYDFRSSMHSNKLGGLDKEIQVLEESVLNPILHDSVAARLGVKMASGVLLHGPPGVGKTLLIKELVKSFQSIPTISVKQWIIHGFELMGMNPATSVLQLRASFDGAMAFAYSSADGSKKHLAVIIIDEIDALIPNNEIISQCGGTGRHIIGQLLQSMDDVYKKQQRRTLPGWVLVLSTTNRPEALDPAIRREGRLGLEIPISAPNKQERYQILSVIAADVPLASDVSLDYWSDVTVGYVGSDLSGLVREAVIIASERTKHIPACDDSDDMAPKDPHGPCLLVSNEDLSGAMLHFPPSSVRSAIAQTISSAETETKGQVDVTSLSLSPANRTSVTSAVPQLVAGYDEVRHQLEQAVKWPLAFKSDFMRLGLTAPRGVLMYGPPGCGKTCLVKEIAKSLESCTFMYVAAADIYDPYLGESEHRIREVFRSAKVCQPTLLFIDEIDGLCTQRTTGESDGGVSKRVLSTLLNEMDGICGCDGVIVIAATNRPKSLGRFDRLVYVPPPDAKQRASILQFHGKKLPLDADVDLEAFVFTTDGFTGAQLESVLNEASIRAMRRGWNEYVHQCDIQTALDSSHYRVLPRSLLDEYEMFDKYRK